MAPSKLSVNSKKAMKKAKGKKQGGLPPKVAKGNSFIVKKNQKANKKTKESPKKGKVAKAEKKNDDIKKVEEAEDEVERLEDDEEDEEDDVEEAGQSLPTGDSIKDGQNAFNWLIAPVRPEDFFRTAWERAPLYVKRSSLPDYYNILVSTNKIEEVLLNNYILFSKNVDITSYRNGKRETHNPPGRATAAVVWDYYKQGCSVRLLNPQTFIPELGRLNAMLQEFFGCFVGSNTYLTPPNTQGFAPHYDDIEAFILQIEGVKQWKLYKPRSPEEMLPRYSSPNFSQDDIGPPVLEVTLHPGDLLYFPRGYIHQATTQPGQHSLHVTLSCYQKNTWGDLLEKLLPAALQVAMEEDVEFRRGLPLNYLQHLGVSYCESDSPERAQILTTVGTLLTRLLEHAPLDAAADQLGKQFMHDAMPPYLTEEETARSVYSANLMTFTKKGVMGGNVSLNEKTRIKLTRAHILRLVKEGEGEEVMVYHCADNSVEYHGEELQGFEISAEAAIGVEALINAYPKYTAVSDLPLPKKEKLELANKLWKKGLILTETPIHNN